MSGLEAKTAVAAHLSEMIADEYISLSDYHTLRDLLLKVEPIADVTTPKRMDLDPISLPGNVSLKGTAKETETMTAVHGVFNTPELLEMVLNNLSADDLLFRARAVCKGFSHGVESSPSIRRKMGRQTTHPAEPKVLPYACKIVDAKIIHDKARVRKANVSRLDIKMSTLHNRRNDPRTLYRDPMFRSMLISDPPLPEYRIRFSCATDTPGQCCDKMHDTCVRSEGTPVNFGHAFDAAIKKQRKKCKKGVGLKTMNIRGFWNQEDLENVKKAHAEWEVREAESATKLGR